jgi:hypothetical protein
VYIDLQNLARRDARASEELFVLYALEGFVDRLSVSEHASRFILKGGALLAAFGARRPTRDVDLAARGLSNDADDVLAVVRDVVSRDHDDGLRFDPDGADAQTIRDEDEYTGVRVSLPCSIATAGMRLHVDVNVGDPIVPAPQVITVPRLLGGETATLGYPLEMVYAEKIVTAIQRGVTNTRWRDFADIHLLSRRQTVAGSTLEEALRVVSRHRGAALVPLSERLEGYPAVAQTKWTAWRRRQQLTSRVPESFSAVLGSVIRLADPALRQEVGNLRWDPSIASWVRDGLP